jgi:hypothetical protein
MVLLLREAQEVMEMIGKVCQDLQMVVLEMLFMQEAMEQIVQVIIKEEEVVEGEIATEQEQVVVEQLAVLLGMEVMEVQELQMVLGKMVVIMVEVQGVADAIYQADQAAMAELVVLF